MAGDDERKPKTCFVVMPVTTPAIYAEKDGDHNHFAHVLSDLFIPALESLGYQVLLPSVAGSELIHAEIIKNLEQADAVLCDLSSLNPNVFFELGIRTALDRPIILVRDKLTLQIPFDLAAINVHMYDSSLKSWTVKDEISRLTAHIKASIKDASGSGNPMWRYFGLTQRAAPAEIKNPEDAKLSLILAELTKLRNPLVTETTTSRPRYQFGEISVAKAIEPPVGYVLVESQPSPEAIYAEGVEVGQRLRNRTQDEAAAATIAGKPRIVPDLSLNPPMISRMDGSFDQVRVLFSHSIGCTS